MGKRSVDGDNIELVANAIRSKGGTTATLGFPDAMATAIKNMPLLSKRINGTVKASGSTSITIPTTGLTTIQSINIYASKSKPSSTELLVDTINIIMSDDGSAVSGWSLSSSTYARYTNFRFFPMNDGNELTVALNASNVVIKVGGGYGIVFNNTYTYDVFGQ